MEYVTIDGTTATVKVVGRYDLTKTVFVNRELEDAINGGVHKVIIDFEETTYIDSSTLRDLVRIGRRIGLENFFYKNANGDILVALQVGKLDTAWTKTE